MSATSILLALTIAAAPVLAVSTPSAPLPAPGAVAGDLSPSTASAGSGLLRVEIATDVPLGKRTQREVDELIALPLGEPMTSVAVRRTLRNLAAIGLFSAVELWSREEEGGVVAIVSLESRLVVESVQMTGDLGLRRGRLGSEILQAAGQPLNEGRILQDVYRLQDRLEQRGFLEATVRVQVETDEYERRATVKYVVASGPRFRVGAVAFDGALGPWTPEELLKPLRLRPGQKFEGGILREEADRLSRWLVNKDHRTARVDVLDHEVDPELRLVNLRYGVEAGPRFEIQVVGADRAVLERKNLLPFLSEDGFDDGLVSLALERIRSYYQSLGHYRVSVEKEEAELGEGRYHRLVITVVPGSVYRLKEVRLDGNEALSSERLRSLMTTSDARPLKINSGRLVDEVLTRDLENLRSFYALDGWLDAEVGPADVQVGEDGESLYLAVPIHEGERRRVVELSFEGFEKLDVEELRDSLALEEGGPFHPQKLDDSLDVVRTLLEESGFLQAQVSATETWNSQGTLVNIEFRAWEGPQTFLDQVLVLGGGRTHPELIRRVTELQPGQPFSRRGLVDAQRKLSRLGIFSEVHVDPGPLEDGGNLRDALVRVTEGKNQRLIYGLGYDSDEGAAVILGAAHSNLWNRGATFQLDLRLTESTERFRLLLTQPYLGERWHIAITGAVYREDVKRPGFLVEETGAQLVLSRRIGAFTLQHLLNYRLVESTPTGGNIDPEDLDRQYLPIEIASLLPSMVWDRRDDPLNPHKGWLTTVFVQYSFPVLSAEEHFLKSFVQQAYFADLGRAGVLAGSVRLGGIEPLSDREIPLSERFFAGGRTSHRAFPRDLLGIQGETRVGRNAVGGNGLLLVNLDYRFPFTRTIGGTLFVDLGNVWAEWRDITLDQVRYGAGAEVRYLSPVGPIRLTAGWKLDREPEESAYEVFLSFGHAF